MRKLVVLLFLVMLIIATPTYGAANTKNYEIPELKINIDLPVNWITFTRQVAAFDTNIKQQNYDAETIKKFLISNSIYLHSINQAETTEFMLILIENEGTKHHENLTLLSTDSLNEFTKNMIEEAKGNIPGYTLIDSTIYQHKQAIFIHVTFSQESNGVKMYGIQDYTIVNGQGFSLTLQSRNKKITPDLQETQRAIVDSCYFSGVIRDLKMEQVRRLVQEMPIKQEPVRTPKYTPHHTRFRGDALGLTGVFFGGIAKLVSTWFKRKKTDPTNKPNS